MLELRFRQADGGNNLKNITVEFPLGVLCLKRFCPLALTGVLEHVMGAMGPDRQGARFGFGSGARWTQRTGLTVLLATWISLTC